jgi:hypothetical protein
MRQLRLLIGCCLAVLSWNASSAQIGGGDGRGGEVPVHKQPKFAGRANNLANASTPPSKAKEPEKQGTTSTAERKPMSQEERRALRRQISETEMKYPRH